MKIGVLTSSRADYGIYLPLLLEIIKDESIELELIVFGTHLSKTHGHTIDFIFKDGFKNIKCVDTELGDDRPIGIANSYGELIKRFAIFWAKNTYDIILCLGDRFEMSAAIQATIPFNYNIAHFHGGETSEGAIDNIYRHQITMASNYHFVSTEESHRKVCEIKGSDKNVYNVGSLSLNDISEFKPLPKKYFLQKFNIEDKPYILATFHPETGDFSRNSEFAEIMKETLKVLNKYLTIIVTMPNADTQGSVYREKLLELKQFNSNNRIYLIENFGKENYFNAMHYSEMIIGNSSSGIIEAASFNKYVLNIGTRQKGRYHGLNVFHSPYHIKTIINRVEEILKMPEIIMTNPYYKENTVSRVLRVLKSI